MPAVPPPLGLLEPVAPPEGELLADSEAEGEAGDEAVDGGIDGDVDGEVLGPGLGFAAELHPAMARAAVTAQQTKGRRSFLSMGGSVLFDRRPSVTTAVGHCSLLRRGRAHSGSDAP
ncbi:hypothetical protein [Streptacidiphilus fuscans]|uniref:Uncharacterized protein n=1 Tax=Streptacidiphilus fuscans TaxID=2789292 RepID=A0A931B2X0_9ACTN|nr:hypothetical protein [Streptacidiphilus fuscans]MBF9069298.1 hypothetical protein [Streptacidiphilus fuscans]